MSENKEPNYKFSANMLVLVGFAVAFLIASLWMIKMAPGVIKLVGFIAAIVSIYVGWMQLASLKDSDANSNTINNNSKQEKEDGI